MSARPRPPQSQQVGQCGAEFVAGRFSYRREAPVLRDLLAAVGKDAEMGLGVADIDDEQHPGHYRLLPRCAPPGQLRAAAVRPGGPPAPVPARRDGVGQASGRREGVSSGSSSSRGTSTNRLERTSACGQTQARRERKVPGPEQQQVDVDHARTVARSAGRAPEHPLDRLGRRRAAPAAHARSRIRTQALRNSGWSRTSPTGSVS